MTYAIIETGGKQVRVEPGRFYDIELLTAQPDEKVSINTVLLVQHNGTVTVGQPTVEGASVEGTIMRHFRDRKVLVYKMKPKKKTRKKRGHRQEVTRLMIDSITMNGSPLEAAEAQTASTDDATDTSTDALTDASTDVSIDASPDVSAETEAAVAE